MKRINKDIEVSVEGLIFKVTRRNSGVVAITGVITSIFLTSRLGREIGTIDVSGANLLVVKGRNLDVYDYNPNLVTIDGFIEEIKPYRIEDGKKIMLNCELERCDNE